VKRKDNNPEYPQLCTKRKKRKEKEKRGGVERSYYVG